MLDKISTRAPEKVDKEKTKIQTLENQKKIGELQNILFAQRKYSLLLIFQGIDASGKDGAIRSICSSLNPLGFRVFSYKKPTEEELNHDFLWRIHKNTPEKGYIHVFNRSQYEDILVPSVEKFLTKKLIDERYERINQFEHLLEHHNTKVIKFYLHVSREEQLERLQERITEPKKFWKHNDGDWATREKWAEYRQVYESIIKKCDYTAWNIIPSDQNWYKEFLISETILTNLQSLDLQWPALETELFKDSAGK